MTVLHPLEARGDFSTCYIAELPHNMYKLTHDLYYTWYAEGYVRRLKVPQGFPFDGASINELGTFITWVIPWFETIHPMGAHWKATAFHDWIWMYQGRIPVGYYDILVGDKWVDIEQVPELAYKVVDGKVFDFHSSNRLFGRMLKDLDYPEKERRTMVWAVGTIFGKRNWKKGTIPLDARPLAA